MDDQNKTRVIVDSDLEDLVPDFLVRKKEDVDTIVSLLENGDFGQIRILGHSMKGAGGGYGFHRITEIGAIIEDAALIKNRDKILEIAGVLRDYLGNIEVVYE